MSTSIRVITASRDEKKYNVMKHSFSKNLPTSAHLEFLRITNAPGLCAAYNRALEHLQDKKDNIYIFCHEDIIVKATPLNWLDLLRSSELPDIGFLGVAGARNLISKDWWNPVNGGSGKIEHTDGYKIWPSVYGPIGTVTVLDGVFLAIRPATLIEIGGFHKDLPGFDYYDIEATLRATIKGKNNKTIDFKISHQSIGAGVTSESWRRNSENIWKEYKDILPFQSIL